jgi:hypothetical protein
MAYNLGEIDPEDRTELYADPREEEHTPVPRRLLRIGIALVVMGVFAGGVWLAYTAGMRHGGGAAASADIPLIRADTTPIKVKPENPGGMPVPDRDMLIYGQQRPQVEHLLPPPEQPMARPAPPPAPAPPPPQQTAALAPPAAAPAPPPAPPAAAPPPPPAVPTPAAAAATPSPVAAPPAAAPPASPAPARPALSPAALAAARELGIAVAENSPRPAASRTAAAGRAGGLRLQLGAMRSETEARGAWERLKHQNSDLLGRLSAVAIRADLGGKGVYYRIQAGPVADASTADRICGELRQRHLACVIAR